MKILREVQVDGYYMVDTGISVSEWIEILQDDEFMRASYKDTLIKFYKESGHKSTCKKLSEKYGKNSTTYNGSITQFGKAVQERLNRFQILRSDGGRAYWPVTMNGKLIGNNFEWTIKPELVEALEMSGILSYDPVREMLNRYKELVKKGELKYELYKWELVQKFRGRPNVLAENFAEEIKSLDISNLAYRMTKAVMDRIADKNPDHYKASFVKLFNEEILLNDRVKTFIDEIRQIYKSQGETLSPHHNEREISTFLTFHNPEKYTFYMPTFYDFYCKMIGVKSKSVGEKYGHYLNLVDELIENYILKDAELLELVDAELNAGNYYHDKKRKILAQDILRIEQKLNEDRISKTTIIANITWNSSDWKEPSSDVSGHEWVKQGGIPHESWNFDFDNPRNIGGKVLGFAKFTNPPKIKGSDSLVVFYSKDNIVGFYGAAELLPETISISDNESYNIVGARNLSILLKNKIENVNASGYLEKKKRIGQGGFNYLKRNETIVDIIEEAIGLNPEQENELNYLLEWFLGEESQTHFKEQLVEPITKKIMKYQPLNQIIYGPPGTGKTYNTINKAINIINPAFDTEENREKTKHEFNKLVEAGQIVFTTFHQSMTYEDFVEGIKPQKPSEEDNFLKYDIEPGIFKKICITAQTPNQQDFSTAYNQLIRDLEEIDKLELKTPTNKSYYVGLNSNNNLSLYTGVNAKLNGSLTKELLQIFFQDNDVKYWYGYYAGVAQYLKDRYGYSNDKKKKSQNFVLIIDEINRGNISQIFGELITLIEEDKRLGNSEELEVTLPYSKEKFGIPANLYIIATMNTADRSVEALDTALRRRFSFEEILPNYDIITQKGKAENGVIENIDLAKLLSVINKRIELLLDRDHQIGHSYFLPVSNLKMLKEAFHNKIIPLLQEYFFGDFGKIGLTLGKGFVELDNKHSDNDKFFAEFHGDYSFADYLDRPVYKILNPMDMSDDEFIEAINVLMNE